MKLALLVLLFFKDKTVASEVVVAADLPNSYSYQPYAFNNPMCMLADYAKSTMRVEADGENTRVIWGLRLPRT